MAPAPTTRILISAPLKAHSPSRGFHSILSSAASIRREVMMNRRFRAIRTVALAVALLATAAVGAGPPTDAAGGGAASTLKWPRDLRELVFLSSGYGMAYGPAAAAAKKAGGP